MRHRLSVCLFIGLAACGVGSAGADRPIALSDADLVAEGVGYGSDSASVVRTLGPPASRSAGVWAYPGLTIWLQGPAVHQIALTGSGRQTVRGLKVGDSAARLATLYGPSCYEDAYVYCRTVGEEPDERGMMVQVADRRVTEIRLGAVFDLD